MQNYPKVGAKYRHFKGMTVRVLGHSKDSETLVDMVIYLELTDGQVWVRPVTMWFDHIERPGVSGPRFTEVEE